MKRETKRSMHQRVSYTEDPTAMTRTTLFLTNGLNRCLDLLALKLEEPKGKVIRDLLEKGLKAQGIDPTKKIRITFESVD